MPSLARLLASLHRAPLGSEGGADESEGEGNSIVKSEVDSYIRGIH